MELADILKAAVTQKATDIILTGDQPPMIRLAGHLVVLQGAGPIPAKEVGRLIFANLFEEQRAQLQEKLALNCSLIVPNLARFRMNVASQQNGLHAVIHVIPPSIPRPEELELPQAVTALADLSRGMVLVTGPSGSGKSSTLACLMELINTKRSCHIVTIEDPIEFAYTNKNSIICQREIGSHTHSIGAALQSVLKQSADVVQLGELRDMETAEAALHIAESGPLVMGTLSTTDTMHTVERIVSMFPVEQHKQIQLRLASNLKAAIAQITLPRADGKGLVAAREIMIMNPTIEGAIREGKTPQIYPAIEAGAKQGMINMDKSIFRLLRNKVVTYEAALEKCNHPDALQAAASALK